MSTPNSNNLREAQKIVIEEAFQKKYQWNCSACTFLNDGFKVRCAICNTPNNNLPPSWKCRVCSSVNNGIYVTCAQCNNLRQWSKN